MNITKICMACFRKYFGEDAKIGTLTWSSECHACRKPTQRGGLLIKADVTATVAAEQESR